MSRKTSRWSSTNAGNSAQPESDTRQVIYFVLGELSPLRNEFKVCSYKIVSRLFVRLAYFGFCRHLPRASPASHRCMFCPFNFTLERNRHTRGASPTFFIYAYPCAVFSVERVRRNNSTVPWLSLRTRYKNLLNTVGRT